MYHLVCLEVTWYKYMCEICVIKKAEEQYPAMKKNVIQSLNHSLTDDRKKDSPDQKADRGQEK